MRGRDLDLPPAAREYMTTAGYRSAEVMVVMFHRWLRRQRLELVDVTAQEVNQFLHPTRRSLKSSTRNSYRCQLRKYIAWMYERGLIRIQPDDIDGRRDHPLKTTPPLVADYIELLKPTKRPATWRGYRSCLRRFHTWLENRGRVAGDVDREVIQHWLVHLHDCGQAASTRVGTIATVRRYLAWLHETGLVETPADELIRSSDFPQKPKYLPRPVPPEADRAIQERLERSDDPLATGLLIMRRTGLRIGELCRLAHDCVRHDSKGRHFLKVPLGKLNSERLVPLDRKTRRLIEDLQASASPGQQWLFEAARQGPVKAKRFRKVLRVICTGIDIPDGMTTHRLRHTYATAMLNAGMSLTSVMRLLGHRDVTMTLRYAAVTQETVGRDYFEALSRLEERYQLQQQPNQIEAGSFDPTHALEDVIRWLKKRSGPTKRRDAGLLIRRIEKLIHALQELAASQ